MTAALLTLLSCRAEAQSPSATDSPRSDASEREWVDFDPGKLVGAEPLWSLRHLNEPQAGSRGFIVVRDGQFVYPDDGTPVRFWGVNGPPSDVTDFDELKKLARALADRGVNLVRWHSPVFDSDGDPDPERIARVIDVVEAMKEAGIYTHLSIYFPLWFKPGPEHPWLKGYDGNQPPFAALYFHSTFQEKYRSWWSELLTTPSPRTGRRLIEEPAVFGAEIINEDSFFFWTFKEENLPPPQLAMLEEAFGEWAAKRHGGIDRAIAAWGGRPMQRDAADAGRLALRPLWNMFNERTDRDRDTATFLYELQRGFYEDIYEFLRGLGFRGLIHASNWTTASAERLGPLEKLSYTAGDFIDRHGYFSCMHRGENAAWSIRPDHTFVDRSALRFDGEPPSKGRAYVNPVMDPKYDNLPSMISETTFNRPNRHRSEAPLYYAVYGALQDSNAIIHFALDGADWQVKPRFWMQPWTLPAPAMMGQFPAAAAIYRRGLVDPGPVLVELRHNRKRLFEMQDTPLPQGAAFDELRLADVDEQAAVDSPMPRVDPLIHFAGRVSVEFTDREESLSVRGAKRWIDRSEKRVRSATGQLDLDYGTGVLRIDSPRAQGASGNLKDAGTVRLRHLEIDVPLDVAHVVLVPLDDRPIQSSAKMLLQVMSEEQPTGFRTEPHEQDGRRILDIGRDPWQIRALRGRIKLLLSGADRLSVQPLDGNGRAKGESQQGAEIDLLPDSLYYLIERQ